MLHKIFMYLIFASDLGVSVKNLLVTIIIGDILP